MSNSKFRNNGQSLYIDNWNPTAKRYINICSLCGQKGYSPAIEEGDFIVDLEHQAIYNELRKMFRTALVLDEWGRCLECAKLQE